MQSFQPLIQKNETILNEYCFPIKSKKKKFGESRITILNSSMVDLSEK